jgi:hypothetical protein
MKKSIFTATVIIVMFFTLVNGKSDDKSGIYRVEVSDTWYPMDATAWTKLPSKSRSTSFYVRGFLDALVHCRIVGSLDIEKWLLDCEGMDVQQIVDTIDKFYKDYPQLRDKPPALVLIEIIPRLRKGLPPIPPDTTRNK